MLRRLSTTAVRVEVSITVASLAAEVDDDTAFMVLVGRKDTTLSTSVKWPDHGKVFFDETLTFAATLFRGRSGYTSKTCDLQVER